MATTINTLAGEFFDAFMTKTRDDKSAFTCLKDDAPLWVRGSMSDVHGTDMFPDDWRYNVIWNACARIADMDEENAKDNDALFDEANEFADTQVDIYTQARMEWLASSIARVHASDEAWEELGGKDDGIIERAGLGQYFEARGVFERLVEALQGQLEEEEEVEDA